MPDTTNVLSEEKELEGNMRRRVVGASIEELHHPRGADLKTAPLILDQMAHVTLVTKLESQAASESVLLLDQSSESREVRSTKRPGRRGNAHVKPPVLLNSRWGFILREGAGLMVRDLRAKKRA